MYIAVGALLAVSLAILERFEQRLYEVYQK
jgi:hypothetical protein